MATKTNQKMILSRTEYNNLYVAVEGEIEDWACYVGKRSDSIEYVKAYGDKIYEEKARELFPEFQGLRWRA
jgi:hypothetical protein